MGVYDTSAFRDACFGSALAREENVRMQGRDYIAVVRLTDKAGRELAAAGQPCDRVALRSLPWLLEQGLIRFTPRIYAGRCMSSSAGESASVPSAGEGVLNRVAVATLGQVDTQE